MNGAAASLQSSPWPELYNPGSSVAATWVLGMRQRHNSTTVPMRKLGARLHSGLELIHAIVLPFVNAQARLV